MEKHKLKVEEFNEWTNTDDARILYASECCSISHTRKRLYVYINGLLSVETKSIVDGSFFIKNFKDPEEAINHYNKI